MPTYVEGDLWGELGQADLLLVTTNSVINARGELVMGRGAAREATQRFPGLARVAAEGILLCGVLPYGVLHLCWANQKTRLGIFQVKRHWRDVADMTLIAFSTGMLCGIAGRFNRVALNFPGIGNGGLKPAQVLPWLALLPPHVYIYTFPEG